MRRVCVLYWHARWRFISPCGQGTRCPRFASATPSREERKRFGFLGPAVGKKLLRDKKKPRKQRHGSPRRTSRAHPHDDCNPSPHPHLNMSLAATSSRVVVRLPTLARVARKSGTRAVTTTRASSAETVRNPPPEKPADFFSGLLLELGDARARRVTSPRARVERVASSKPPIRHVRPERRARRRLRAPSRRFRPRRGRRRRGFRSLGTTPRGVSIDSLFRPKNRNLTFARPRRNRSSSSSSSSPSRRRARLCARWRAGAPSAA